MKIAISTDGDQVSAHFGRCPQFTIAEIDDGKLIKKETIDNPGHQPGFLPKFLNEQGVKVILAGGMGMNARNLFDQYGIKAMAGITGQIDDVINQFAQGTLKEGESTCSPQGGKGYGIEREGGHCDDHDHKHNN